MNGVWRCPQVSKQWQVACSHTPVNVNSELDKQRELYKIGLLVCLLACCAQGFVTTAMPTNTTCTLVS
jgi:hypothetical protein